MKTVTAAIVITNDNVLLTRRAPGEKLAGWWEFPGGKLEEGETLAGCLARELREELGVTAAVGEVVAESVYRYDHGAIRLVGLAATLATTDFTLTVHDRAEWVPVTELLDYRLAPADIPLARRVQELAAAGDAITPC